MIPSQLHTVSRRGENSVCVEGGEDLVCLCVNIDSIKAFNGAVQESYIYMEHPTVLCPISQND